MNKEQWQKIISAKDLFGLHERATLKQIKAAYRRKAKKHHPDADSSGLADGGKMSELNEAYNLLLEYCNKFSYPLTPEASGEQVDADDWWMDRFGADPLWSKGQGD